MAIATVQLPTGFRSFEASGFGVSATMKTHRLRTCDDKSQEHTMDNPSDTEFARYIKITNDGCDGYAHLL